MRECAIIVIESGAILYGLGGLAILFLACLILTMAKR